MSRKRKNKYEYTYHYEPVCECMQCGEIHLRKKRKKRVPEDTSKYLCIYLCPKCKCESYTLVGDKETRRRIKDNEQYNGEI